MSQTSSIEWTDATWNPVRGCTKISPGCAHCYAAQFAERFRGVPHHPYEQGFDIRLVLDKLTDPLNWSSAKRIFVNSMSDIFHESVTDDYIARIADVVKATPWHTFQTLTKRPERLEKLTAGILQSVSNCDHVWWGVSVEDRRHGVPRIETLRNFACHTRFLSIEPLLENLGEIDLRGIAWVIVGGESGHGARPMHADWVRSLQRQCEDASVPFFVKQWGGRQKKPAGRTLDGNLYDATPDCAVRRDVPAMATRESLVEMLKSLWVKRESISRERLLEIGRS